MIRRCTLKDLNWITILTANNFDLMCDDGLGKKQVKSHVKKVLINPGITVLTPAPGQMLLSFVKLNRIMFDMHITISETCQLNIYERLAAAREACEWMVDQGARKLVANIPATNRAARFFAQKAGLRQVGIITSAFLKHGKLIDIIVFQSTDAQMKEYLEV